MTAETTSALAPARVAGRRSVDLVEDVRGPGRRRPARRQPRGDRAPRRRRSRRRRAASGRAERRTASAPVDLGPAARDADRARPRRPPRASRRCRSTCTGTPSIWIVCADLVARRAGRSRVTIASSAPASAFSSELLPTFGWPARTTRMPSRSSAPWRARRQHRVDAARARRASRPRASARSRKSISSSGKSSVASTSMRSSTSASASGVDLARERAVERARRRARRGFGARVDQVGHRLGLGQVELVVEEGALGELAGLGEAQAAAGAPRRMRVGLGRGLEAAREQQLQHDRRRRAPAARARLRRCRNAAPESGSPGRDRSARRRRSRNGT